MSPTTTAAYLGPANSYTHQAALALLPPSSSSLIPYTSIAAAYQSAETYAVLPLENTIFGVVQETLTCLLSDGGSGNKDTEERNGRWRIVCAYDKRVDHCLVVPSSCSDEQLGEIAWVASHEQALGQCAKFLNKTLPRAQLVKTPSTAQAAEALASLTTQHHQNGSTHTPPPHSRPGEQTPPPNPKDVNIIPEELHARPGAAICSEAAVGGLQGLRVVRKGVQDVAGEFGRKDCWKSDTGVNPALGNRDDVELRPRQAV
ncbi:hypothetical protein QFC21_001059 [Naganishia friedmannii]|uniref:Uncharacterized protein n=1 Tax=Naganishia friedmannii TaxID=89922 RepID=A0ACC2W8H3_9TREE|nr:hypothetical protein QFC21_001059 [Naganishia friedmannii]